MSFSAAPLFLISSSIKLIFFADFLGAFLPQIIIFAPYSEKLCEIPLPIPLEPPVIIIVLFLKLILCLRNILCLMLRKIIGLYSKTL